MKKQMISFTDPQGEYLEAESERLGISVAELVRRMVDWYRETYPLVAKVSVEDGQELAEGSEQDK